MRNQSSLAKEFHSMTKDWVDGEIIACNLQSGCVCDTLDVLRYLKTRNHRTCCKFCLIRWPLIGFARRYLRAVKITKPCLNWHFAWKITLIVSKAEHAFIAIYECLNRMLRTRRYRTSFALGTINLDLSRELTQNFEGRDTLLWLSLPLSHSFGFYCLAFTAPK